MRYFLNVAIVWPTVEKIQERTQVLWTYNFSVYITVYISHYVLKRQLCNTAELIIGYLSFHVFEECARAGMCIEERQLATASDDPGSRINYSDLCAVRTKPSSK